MTRTTQNSKSDFDDAKIIERPDGFYLQDKLTGEESGPYATFLEAVTSMEGNANTELEPGEGLKEAEEELGIADWIDPDTGDLAEESVPHLEDH
jgi:hypothetical protein